MLPHLMRYNIPGSPAKFADIAALMGEDIEGLTDREAALLAAEAVEDLLTTVDISFHLRDYGIKESDIPRLVEGGMKFARLFVLNPRDMSEADVRSVYEEAY
jgi:alcohol dehydrogenase class IV